MKLKKMLIMILVLMPILSALQVLAFEPYAGYNYDSWNKSVPAPNGYQVSNIITGSLAKTADFVQPADMFYRDGILYVLDSGNARIVMLDRQYQYIGELSEFKYKNSTLTIPNAQGLFVNAKQEIYIADTANKRVIHADKNGTVIRLYTKPDNPVYPDEIEFSPIKVLADSTGDVYVLVKGLYYGAVRYNMQGEFKDFYGANYVQVTAAQLIDKMWKKILTKDQTKYISKYVPVYFQNFDIDKEDFVYTVTHGSGTFNEIKKINNIGANILKNFTEGQTLNKSDYGDKEKLYYAGKYVDTWFGDIEISDNNLINGLDIERNRVFQYDQESNLLFVFGGTGSQKGLFKKAVAIESINDDVLVLDTERGDITVFSTNDFGKAVHEAVSYYQKGLYDKAVEPWKTVLKYNANYDTAYIGIGKALSQQQKYEESLSYFKLGYDRASYSQSYKVVRAEKIKSNFGFVAVAIVLFVLLVVFRSKIRNFIRAKLRKPAYVQSTHSPFYVMKHPFEGFDDIRRTKNRKDLLVSVVIAVSWFIATAMEYEYTGFIFNLNKPNTLNIWIVLVQTIGLSVLFAVSNWGISVFLDGEGTLKRIWIVTAYSMLPYTVCSFIVTLLSNVATLDEGAIIAWIGAFGTLWSAFLIFNGIKEVHQFSGLRTVFCILASIAGMMFCLFVFVLSFTLVRQLIMFFITIANELMLRTF